MYNHDQPTTGNSRRRTWKTRSINPAFAGLSPSRSSDAAFNCGSLGEPERLLKFRCGDLLTVAARTHGEVVSAIETADNHRLEACVPDQFRCDPERILVVAGNWDCLQPAVFVRIAGQHRVAERVERAHDACPRKIFRRRFAEAVLLGLVDEFLAVARDRRIAGIEHDLAGKRL